LYYHFSKTSKNIVSIPISSKRRALLQKLGAASGAIALPGLVRADNDVENPVSDETSSDEAPASNDAVEPELEKYGIRNFKAPEIVLDYWIDAKGNPTDFSLNEQQGKWLFIKFFQNWCPGCHKSGFPTLKKFVDAFHDHPDVAAIAVQTVFEGFDVNSKQAVRELQLRYELPIVMGHDVGTELTDNHPLSMINYRTGGTPWLILVSPDGYVVYNDFHVDPNSLIEFVKQQVA